MRLIDRILCNDCVRLILSAVLVCFVFFIAWEGADLQPIAAGFVALAALLLWLAILVALGPRLGARQALGFALAALTLFAAGLAIYPVAQFPADHWRKSPPKGSCPKELRVFTLLSPEELRVLRQLLVEFEETHDVRIDVTNRTREWVTDEKQNRKDALRDEYHLLIYDLNWRNDLLKPDIIVKELKAAQDSTESGCAFDRFSKPQHFPISLRDLQPASLLFPWSDALQFPWSDALEERVYFIPYRINVELTFIDLEVLERGRPCPEGESRPCKCPPKEPHPCISGKCTADGRCPIASWGDLFGVIEKASSQADPKASSQADPRPLGLKLRERDDRALFLYQYMLACGLALDDLPEDLPPCITALRNDLRELHQSDLLRPELRYDDVTGHLVLGRVAAARSWTFTLSLLHEGDHLRRFHVEAGLAVEPEQKPAATLLGGDIMAIPCGVESRDVVECSMRLMHHLLSREAQERIAADLAWPVLRADVQALKPWQRQFAETVREALRIAEPTPAYWSQEVADQLASLLDKLIDFDSDPFQTAWEESRDAINKAAQKSKEQASSSGSKGKTARCPSRRGESRTPAEEGTPRSSEDG